MRLSVDHSSPKNQVAFKSYQSPLKTLFKKGQMPSVTRGLYGEKITPQNVSLEHLKPFSHGGRTDLCNLALAEKNANSARGSKPLAEVLSWDMLEAYLSQFNFKIRNLFDGFAYQDKVRETCVNLGMVDPNPKRQRPSKKILRSMRNKAKKASLNVSG